MGTMFEVTYTRQNDTSDGSAEESTLRSQHLAKTPARAEEKAHDFWVEQGQPVDEFVLVSTVDLDD